MMAGMAPPVVADDDEIPNVSPEEQAVYEEFVLAGIALIYDEGKVRPGILKMLDEDPSDLIAVLGNVPELKEFSPVVAVAATGAMIALEIVRKSGDEKPEGEIIMQGGKAILEDLIDICGKAKIHDFTPDEANRAMLMAADLYREAGSAEGLVDEEALKAEFDEIVTADRDGRLGEVLPELDKINKLAERNMVEGDD